MKLNTCSIQGTFWMFCQAKTTLNMTHVDNYINGTFMCDHMDENVSNSFQFFCKMNRNINDLKFYDILWLHLC